MEAAAYSNIYEIEERLWWYHGRRKVCFDLLDRHLPRKTELEILDVGCGTGYNLQLLQRYGRARGVDMAPEALEFCRKRGLCEVELHDAGGLPFADEQFDLLTAFDVIEHIEDDVGALKEFRRVMKPGATLLIYTPALPWFYGEHDRIVHHKRRYMLGVLRERISAAGFVLEHSAYVNFFVLPLVIAARVKELVFPSGGHQEMEIPPAPVNEFLRRLSLWESGLVLRAMLPVGLSLVALARRPH